MIDSPSLTHFLSSLVTEKHGADISAEAHDQLVAELSPRLEKWLIMKALEEIGNASPEALQKFNELATDDTEPHVIMEFIESHITNSEVFFAKAMVDFGQLYLHPETATT